jgi:Uma2 family endonuclease
MNRPPVLPPFVRGEWIPMTSEEFDAWAPEGPIAEWVDGKGIIFVTSSARHVRIGSLLKTLLRLFVDLTGVGEVLDAPFEMRLRDGGSRRESDILVVLPEHADRVRCHWLEGPADLVFELVSEFSVQNDLVEKRREYEAASIPEYVTVDTGEGHETLTYLRLDTAGRYQEVQPDAQGRFWSAVLPGFLLQPVWLWQDPLPRPEELLLEIAPEAYRRYLRSLLDDPTVGR